MPIEIKSVGIYTSSKVKRQRLIFAAKCLAQVFPEKDEDRIPKARLFEMAARLGMTLQDRPYVFDSIRTLRVYMRNHWKMIRYMLPKEHGFVPSYINGATWGGGGGYRKSDKAHVQRQLERDRKIADGVANAANDYAETVGLVFPSIETTRVSLVSRRIERKK
jgi:hypothetical protein